MFHLDFVNEFISFVCRMKNHPQHKPLMDQIKRMSFNARTGWRFGGSFALYLCDSFKAIRKRMLWQEDKLMPPGSVPFKIVDREARDSERDVWKRLSGQGTHVSEKGASYVEFVFGEGFGLGELVDWRVESRIFPARADLSEWWDPTASPKSELSVWEGPPKKIKKENRKDMVYRYAP